MWQVINTHVSWVKSVVWLWNVENRRSPLLPSSGSSYCFACLSLSMWWQSLRAGPSFNPMYFIIMSLRKSIKALPSISCGKAKQSIYYKIYSSILFWKSAKNNWKHEQSRKSHVFPEELCVWAQCLWISITHKLHHFLYTPGWWTFTRRFGRIPLCCLMIRPSGWASS